MVRKITVQVEINIPIEKVWEFWTKPEHIVNWNFASEDWECPSAENNLKIQGRFKIKMSAKDKSEGFDFEGTYTNIKKNELIEYMMDDGRKVKVVFSSTMRGTEISETFEAENENSEELQRKGWQEILNNFKKYSENENNKLKKDKR